MPEKKTGNVVLKVGWWVALTLKPNVAPLRCYVGQIQAMDAESIRITLVDWFSGMAVGWDFFVPRANIESALVCTPGHDLKAFGEAAGKWQDRVEKLGKEGEQEKQPE